jgi:hypothetical protein
MKTCPFCALEHDLDTDYCAFRDCKLRSRGVDPNEALSIREKKLIARQRYRLTIKPEEPLSVTLYCSFCGKPFAIDRTNYSQWYCCIDHKDELAMVRAEARVSRSSRCIICSKVHTGTAKTCSPECTKAYRRKIAKENMDKAHDEKRRRYRIEVDERKRKADAMPAPRARKGQPLIQREAYRRRQREKNRQKREEIRQALQKLIDEHEHQQRIAAEERISPCVT